MVLERGFNGWEASGRPVCRCTNIPCKGDQESEWLDVESWRHIVFLVCTHQYTKVKNCSMTTMIPSLYLGETIYITDKLNIVFLFWQSLNNVRNPWMETAKNNKCTLFLSEFPHCTTQHNLINMIQGFCFDKFHGLALGKNNILEPWSSLKLN